MLGGLARERKVLMRDSERHRIGPTAKYHRPIGTPSTGTTTPSIDNMPAKVRLPLKELNSGASEKK
jgi:hypothetical protein